MNNSRPQRKSPRLTDFDYSQAGVYFVTICSHRRLSLFGDIHDSILVPSTIGMLAQQEIEHLSTYWQNVEVDCAVVMPNHVHMMVAIFDPPKLTSATDQIDVQRPNPTLGHIIGNYKSAVTRLARQAELIKSDGLIWQSRYHDHIVRNDQALNTIREYVLNNPARWQEDTFYNG